MQQTLKTYNFVKLNRDILQWSKQTRTFCNSGRDKSASDLWEIQTINQSAHSIQLKNLKITFNWINPIQLYAKVQYVCMQNLYYLIEFQ
jgi:hypothetical protein